MWFEADCEHLSIGVHVGLQRQLTLMNVNNVEYVALYINFQYPRM